MNDLQNALNEIKHQKEEYLVPENIKKDVTVLGVTGALEARESFDVDLPERIDYEVGKPGGLKIPLPRDTDFYGCTAVATFLGKEKQMEYWNTNYLGQVSNTYLNWDSVEQRYNLEVYLNIWNKDIESFDYGLRVNFLKNGIYSQSDIVLDVIIPDYIYVQVGFFNKLGNPLNNVIQEQNVTMVYEDGTAVPFEKLQGYYTDTFLVEAKHDVNITIDIDGDICTAQLNGIEEAIARGDTSVYMSVNLNISVFTANLFLLRDNGTFRQAYDFAETTLNFYDENDNIIKTVVSANYYMNDVKCINATRCEATIRSFEYITPHIVSLPNGAMVEHMIIPDERPNQRVYMTALKYLTESGQLTPVSDITNYSGTISNSVTPEEMPIELQCIGATIGCVTDITEDVSWEVLHATVNDPRYEKLELHISTSETEPTVRNVASVQLRKEEPLDPAYAYKTIELINNEGNLDYKFDSTEVYNPGVDLQTKINDFATRHSLGGMSFVCTYDRENDVAYCYRGIEPNLSYVNIDGKYYYAMPDVYDEDPTEYDDETLILRSTLDFKNDTYVSSEHMSIPMDVKSVTINGKTDYFAVFPENFVGDAKVDSMHIKRNTLCLAGYLYYRDAANQVSIEKTNAKIVPIEKLNP